MLVLCGPWTGFWILNLWGLTVASGHSGRAFGPIQHDRAAGSIRSNLTATLPSPSPYQGVFPLLYSTRQATTVDWGKDNLELESLQRLATRIPYGRSVPSPEEHKSTPCNTIAKAPCPQCACAAPLKASEPSPEWISDFQALFNFFVSITSQLYILSLRLQDREGGSCRALG
ncbi:hypothetical protein Zmor_015149 [Zophobas morio]|uniref:Uncharacterized protein n=1 Tax=Zophobas morio TaxID=2755281 RepID=A0AA38MH04_9CUCU|nr:hypothetical protein Zmor_015114 [Zophobas morio]KAJ3656046.1 hypothetical protein Zmor_015149 [Zophobas morio]